MYLTGVKSLLFIFLSFLTLIFSSHNSDKKVNREPPSTKDVESILDLIDVTKTYQIIKGSKEEKEQGGGGGGGRTRNTQCFNSEYFNRKNDTIINYKIIHPILFEKIQNILVKKDSLLFNGYLVFKIYKNPNKGIYNTDDDFFICDIYWVNDLKDIESESKKYLLITPTIASDIYIDGKEDSDTSYNFINFKNFYKAYKRTVNDDSVTVPFLRRSLTTRIFLNNYFWNHNNNDSIGYYIFNNSFLAYYVRGDLEYGDETYTDNYYDTNYINLYIYNAKILFPITSAYYFRSVDSSTMQNQGFKISDWLPKDIYLIK